MTYALEVRCSIQLSYRGIVERVGNIFQAPENRQADSNPMNSIPFSSERFLRWYYSSHDFLSVDPEGLVAEMGVASIL